MMVRHGRYVYTSPRRLKTQEMCVHGLNRISYHLRVPCVEVELSNPAVIQFLFSCWRANGSDSEYRRVNNKSTLSSIIIGHSSSPVRKRIKYPKRSKVHSLNILPSLRLPTHQRWMDDLWSKVSTPAGYVG